GAGGRTVRAARPARARAARARVGRRHAVTRPSRAPFAVAMLGGSALVVLLLVRPAPLGGEVGSGGPTPRDPLPRSEPPASPARPATAEPPEPGDPTDRTDPVNPAR